MVQFAEALGRPISEASLIARGFLIPREAQKRLVASFLDVPIEQLFPTPNKN